MISICKAKEEINVPGLSIGTEAMRATIRTAYSLRIQLEKYQFLMCATREK